MSDKWVVDAENYEAGRQAGLREAGIAVRAVRDEIRSEEYAISVGISGTQTHSHFREAAHIFASKMQKKLEWLR